MLSGKYFACVIQQGFKFFNFMNELKLIPNLGPVSRAPISERRHASLGLSNEIDKNIELFDNPTFTKIYASIMQNLGDVYKVRHKSIGVGKDMTADLEKLLLQHIRGFNELKRIVASSYTSIESNLEAAARKVMKWMNKLYVQGNVKTRGFYIMTADDMYTQLEKDVSLIEGFEELGLMGLVRKLETIHSELKLMEEQILSLRAEELSEEQDNQKILDTSFFHIRNGIQQINLIITYSDNPQAYQQFVWKMSSIINRAKALIQRKATMRRNKREREEQMNGEQTAKAAMQADIREQMKLEGYEFEDDYSDSDSDLIQIPELPAWHPSVDGASQPLQNGSLEPKTRDEKSKVI